jgi:hypothetical protein
MKGTWLLILGALLISSSCSKPGETGGGGTGDAVTGRPLLADGDAIDLFKVSEAVWAREAKHGFSGLTEPERTFLCVWNLEAEVNNGGFSQFFANSAGDYASSTPRALRSIGATEMATLVERAMEPFGPSGPPVNREARARAMEALPPSVPELWGNLDREFTDLASPEQGLRALVDGNRSAFIAP